MKIIIADQKVPIQSIATKTNVTVASGSINYQDKVGFFLFGGGDLHVVTIMGVATWGCPHTTTKSCIYILIC